MMTLAWTTFAHFAVMAGLALLAATNHVAPGCTGPAIQRCDYVETAKQAAMTSIYHPFTRGLGFEVFDQGSSVIVQQWTRPGEPELNHASAVLIDKRSCRVCALDWHQQTPRVDPESILGPVLLQTQAEDQEAAARRAELWKDGPGGIHPF